MLIRVPTKGIQGQVPVTAYEGAEAARGTQNIFYDYGFIRTPWGFAKLDLSSGLNSNDQVISVFQWSEIDRTSHLMAITTDKLFDHDRVNNEWDDKTQSGLTMDSNIDNPVSYVECGHDDTAIFIDDDNTKAQAFHHVIVCDGGLSNIQRWAGKFEVDFADLVGGGDYHDGTTHRARQCALSSKNRLILLGVLEFSSSSAVWTENNQRLRWPIIGKIETWTGTGSGFVDLYDTGGVMIWSLPLYSDHIIYQSQGIWSINYVGGTTIFDPRPLIPDLGLLSANGITSHKNVHYFIGNDYNVYAYRGGSGAEIIGGPIHQFLIDDLATQFANRSWITMGPEAKFLWVFIVTSTSGFITKAYVRNMTTGAWTVRDFEEALGTSGGITSVTLAGATTFVIGETYAEALDLISVHDGSDASDVTVRYGDYLIDTSRTLASDLTAGTWSAGGFDYSLAGEDFASEFTENDMLVVFDGSNATNTRWGTHFYTVYDVSAIKFSLWGAQDVAAQGEHGIADNSTNVPADLSVSGANTIGFYSTCSADLPGVTYDQKLESVQKDARIIMGDSSGFVYQIDETNVTDDGNSIDCRHLTGVWDMGRPDLFKRLPPFGLVAEGTVGGALIASYRTGNFDASDTGWTDFTMDLTTEANEKTFYPNDTAKKWQYRVMDFSGKSFKVTELQILDHVYEGNR